MTQDTITWGELKTLAQEWGIQDDSLIKRKIETYPVITATAETVAPRQIAVHTYSLFKSFDLNNTCS